MLTESIDRLIEQGENVRLEFKESRTKLNKDVYETICSFLNRCGGDILLGVTDQGQITGIDPDVVRDLRADIITALNNSAKINPPVYLVPEVAEIDGKTILWINVPESSRIHRCNGRIYDRNGDADLDITDQDDALAIFAIRKQKSYTENTVYPYLTLAELQHKIIGQVRRRATLRTGKHPWANLSDEKMLQSAGLYLFDYTSGKYGYTLAAALLFGRDDVIRSILPFHRTDALLRRQDILRYDDRDDIRTNLIDSYGRLMAFVAKHLNDPFYVEENVRISLRDKIFSEVVSNMLIHREYTNPYTARLIIEKDRVVADNGNKAHGYGEIIPDNCFPHAKNPEIASIFREIGLADEMGSGIRNTYHYSRIYSGSDPVFIEKDVFQTIIPLRVDRKPAALPAALPIRDNSRPGDSGSYLAESADDSAEQDQTSRLLSFCRVPRTRDEILAHLGLSNRNQLNREILKPLVRQGQLQHDEPGKLNSRMQKYLTWRGGNYDRSNDYEAD